MGKNEFTLKSKSKDPSYKRKFGNYPAKKYKKGTPCVTRLSFELDGAQTQYVDLALALSVINRKSFRQGCYYYINSIELYNNENSHVDIHTLPDNWITRAAYRRALGIFNEQNDRAMINTGNVAGKWHDFKVYMSKRHYDTGSILPSLHDINAAHEIKTADDWNYSQLVSADDDGDGSQQADNFFVHMLGGHEGTADNWDTVGIIKSYEDTRARVQAEPNVNNLSDLQADPLFNLFDYSSEEQVNDVLTALTDDANQPPYDMSEMIGNDPRSHQQVARLQTMDPAAGGRRIDMASGFCAPLGLIMIDPQDDVSGPFRIVINVASGTYNGVYAERIA